MKLTTILLSSVLLSGTALAQLGGYSSSNSNWFIGGSYGFANGDTADAIDTGVSFFLGEDGDALNVEDLISIEVGYRKEYNDFAALLSAEFMYGSASNLTLVEGGGFVETDSKQLGVFLNLKAEYDFNNSFFVYGGVGIGSLTVDLEIDSSGPTFKGNEAVFAYQFMVGLEYAVTNQLGIYAQYRYMNSLDFEGFNFNAIEDSFVDVGARFYF